MALCDGKKVERITNQIFEIFDKEEVNEHENEAIVKTFKEYWWAKQMQKKQGI